MGDSAHAAAPFDDFDVIHVSDAPLAHVVSLWTLRATGAAGAAEALFRGPRPKLLDDVGDAVVGQLEDVVPLAGPD